MTTKTLNEHIISTPGVLGGKPRIAGHRISVAHVMVWHEQMGWSAEQIALKFHLTLADVYAALAYYYDHKDEIDTQIQEGEAFVEEMMRQYPSKISPKSLKRRGIPMLVASSTGWASKSHLPWWLLNVEKLYERGS